MNEQQKQTAMTLWSLGRNTKEIADVLKIEEPIVACEMPKLLEQRRAPPSPRTQKTAVDRYAAKLRRCGFPKHVIELEIAKMEAVQ